MKITNSIPKILKVSAITAFIATGFSITPQVVASELVVNSGFEANSIAASNFIITNAVTGWTRDTSSIGTGIELQNNIAGTPAVGAGSQFAELDSNGTTKIFQDLTTTPGAMYELSFLFSPRPNVADNQLHVNWGNNNVASLSANGTGLSHTDWESYSYLLTADANITRLSFDNLGEKSDELGTYLDNVSVKPVPLPGAVWFLASGLVTLGLRRRKIA